MVHGGNGREGNAETRRQLSGREPTPRGGSEQGCGAASRGRACKTTARTARALRDRYTTVVVPDVSRSGIAPVPYHCELATVDPPDCIVTMYSKATLSPTLPPV